MSKCRLWVRGECKLTARSRICHICVLLVQKLFDKLFVPSPLLMDLVTLKTASSHSRLKYSLKVSFWLLCVCVFVSVEKGQSRKLEKQTSHLSPPAPVSCSKLTKCAWLGFIMISGLHHLAVLLHVR